MLHISEKSHLQRTQGFSAVESFSCQHFPPSWTWFETPFETVLNNQKCCPSHSKLIRCVNHTSEQHRIYCWLTVYRLKPCVKLKISQQEGEWHKDHPTLISFSKKRFLFLINSYTMNDKLLCWCKKILVSKYFFLVLQATCNTRLVWIPTQMSKWQLGVQCETQALQHCSLLPGSDGLSRDHICSNIFLPVAGAFTWSDTTF